MFLFLLYPIIASILCFVFKLNFAWSVFLFLGLPSIHLSFLRPNLVLRTLTFSVIGSVPMGLVVDYVAHINKSWFVTSIFSYRLLGLVPIEDMIWVILFLYFVVMFYEYFYNGNLSKKFFGRHLKLLIAIELTITMIFLVLLKISPQLLIIHFFYFWLGLFFVFIPVVIELIINPELVKKFFPVAVYFFLFSFIYEITALKNGMWWFPSKGVVGYISLLGVSFPFEEFFFWFTFMAMACMSYYEFFDDDNR